MIPGGCFRIVTRDSTLIADLSIHTVLRGYSCIRVKVKLPRRTKHDKFVSHPVDTPSWIKMIKIGFGFLFSLILISIQRRVAFDVYHSRSRSISIALATQNFLVTRQE